MYCEPPLQGAGLSCNRGLTSLNDALQTTTLQTANTALGNVKMNASNGDCPRTSHCSDFAARPCGISSRVLGSQADRISDRRAIGRKLDRYGREILDTHRFTLAGGCREAWRDRRNS